jgi:membrane protein DedA with SNARE-associated domain
MKKTPVIRISIIVGILLLIGYCIIDGIRFGSSWGLILAILSLIALVISILLARKLIQLNKQEKEDA